MGTTASPAPVVPVEIAGWVTRFVGGDGSGRRVYQEAWAPGATVRSVLAGLSVRFPDLQRALWNDGEPGEHLEILVNDAVLGIAHEIDSPVSPADRISLIGQFMGGAGSPPERQLPNRALSAAGAMAVGLPITSGTT